MTCLLVIDDHPHTVEYIRGLVDPAWEVISAFDGITGVELVRQHPQIDLVLLDIKMPDPDGYYVATQLRRFNGNLRIIPYTAVDPVHEDPHLQQYMRELGCAEVLPKGMHPQYIQQRLVAALTEVPQIHESALLTQLFRVTDVQYRTWVRQQRQRHEQILIYTTAAIGQIGLKHLLETTGMAPSVVVLADQDQVIPYLMDAEAPIVVTTTNMYDAICGLASTTTPLCPLIIALSVDAAIPIVHQLTHGSQFPCWSVLVDAGTLPATLPLALTALRQGTSFVDPLLTDQTQHLRQYIATRTGVTLNDRDLQLIQFHHQRLDVATVAERLGTSTSNVYQMRTRLYKKLGVTTMDAVLRFAMDLSPSTYGGSACLPNDP